MSHIRDKKFSRFQFPNEIGSWVQAQDMDDFRDWAIREVEKLELDILRNQAVMKAQYQEITDLRIMRDKWAEHADITVKQTSIDESGIQILKDWIEHLLIERQQVFQTEARPMNIEILDANSGFEG